LNEISLASEEYNIHQQLSMQMDEYVSVCVSMSRCMNESVFVCEYVNLNLYIVSCVETNFRAVCLCCSVVCVVCGCFKV